MPNDIMPRKKLIDYLPPFMQDFAEIKAIMQTENPELDQSWLDIQIPLSDAFIMDCDEYGIKKYETLVGIIPNPEDTLDERKAKVIVWWNNFIPYTYRVLVRRLNELCGADNYDISGNLENYELILKINLMLGGQVQSLEHLIIQILPMNINCNVKNEFVCNIDGFMGCVGGVCAIEKVVITSDFKENWNLDGTSMSRGVIDNVASLQISNDIKETTEISGNEEAKAFTVYATRNMPEPVIGTVSIEIRTS